MLDVPLLAGRHLAATDGGAAPVAVISRALAERMGGVAAAVGQGLAVLEGSVAPAATARVVGVVDDVAYDGLAEQGAESGATRGFSARLTAVPLGLGVVAGWALARPLSPRRRVVAVRRRAASTGFLRARDRGAGDLRRGRRSGADAPGAAHRPDADDARRIAGTALPVTAAVPDVVGPSTLAAGARPSRHGQPPARDLVQGFRLLSRAPGFAATAALTLALGIGATTTLFSVVNAVLLDPLPFPDSGRLIQVWRSELPALTYGSASYPRYLDWRASQRPFTELGAWAPRGFTLAGSDGARARRRRGRPRPSFFRVMGAAPVAGRWIHRRRGSAAAANASRSSATACGSGAFAATPRWSAPPFASTASPTRWWAWRRRASPRCGGAEVWMPLGQRGRRVEPRRQLPAVVRSAAPGVTLAAARRSLDAELAPQMTRDHPEDDYTFTARAAARDGDRGRAARLVGAARRHRAAAAHRLHQRRQPAAGAGGRARARPGGARVARAQVAASSSAR